jgi:ribosomal protein S27AE
MVDHQNTNTAKLKLGLKKIKKWRLYKTLLFLAFFPFHIIAFFIVKKITNDSCTFEILITTVTIMYLIIFAYSLIRNTYSKCPRCGNNFFMNTKLPFSGNKIRSNKKCLHCGIHLNQ